MNELVSSINVAAALYGAALCAGIVLCIYGLIKSARG